MWIFGSPRTGSTWLMRMLGDLPGVVQVDEPYIGAHLGPWAAGQTRGAGEPLQRVNDRFADHVGYVLGHERRPLWKPAVRTFILELVEGLSGQGPQTPSFVVIKEPNGSQGADVIMECLPRARLLFLTRDGRDVLGSLIRAEGVEGRPPDRRLAWLESRARAWRFRSEVVSRAFADHPEQLRLRVRYEDLVEDPARELGRIVRWLGADLPADKVATIASHHRRTGAAARRGRAGLTDEELARIVTEIGPMLAELGYEGPGGTSSDN